MTPLESLNRATSGRGEGLQARCHRPGNADLNEAVGIPQDIHGAAIFTAHLLPLLIRANSRSTKESSQSETVICAALAALRISFRLSSVVRSATMEVRLPELGRGSLAMHPLYRSVSASVNIVVDLGRNGWQNTITNRAPRRITGAETRP